MSRLYWTPVLTIIILLAVSCEKILFESPEDSKHTAVFEYIWQYTKEHYCCFDLKEVNWDDVYDMYKPQVNDDMEESEFLILMHEMLSMLKDNGMSVTGQMTKYSYEYDTIYPENIDLNTIKLYKPTSDSYVIYEGVAYFNDFSNEDFAEKLYSIKNDVSGVIVDLRNTVDLPLWSKPIEEEAGCIIRDPINYIQSGYSTAGIKRSKIGPGDNDYYETTFPVGNSSGGANYRGNVVVLSNRKTPGYSAYLASRLRYGTLIGDHSDVTELANKQETYLANGWILSIPRKVAFDLDTRESIAKGVEPDIYISDDPATTDVDEMIEKALELLQ